MVYFISGYRMLQQPPLLSPFPSLRTSLTGPFTLAKYSCQHFPWLELVVSALLWCQSTSAFLVSALFWCQHFSGASAFLVPALFWCQPFSGGCPFLALFWCQHFSGASTFLVPALFWCQRL